MCIAYELSPLLFTGSRSCRHQLWTTFWLNNPFSFLTCTSFYSTFVFIFWVFVDFEILVLFLAGFFGSFPSLYFVFSTFISILAFLWHWTLIFLNFALYLFSLTFLFHKLIHRNTHLILKRYTRENTIKYICFSLFYITRDVPFLLFVSFCTTTFCNDIKYGRLNQFKNGQL